MSHVKLSFYNTCCQVRNVVLPLIRIVEKQKKIVEKIHVNLLFVLIYKRIV